MDLVIKDFEIPTGDKPRIFLTHFHEDGTAEMVALGYPQKKYEIIASDVKDVLNGEWKHVKWVKDEDWQEGGYWISRCSICSMPYHSETPYCPHCGAYMRGKSG